MPQSHRLRSSPYQPQHPRRPKAEKRVTDAIAMATATAANQAKPVPTAKAATNPVAKAVVPAAKAEVTDAIAVVAAVAVVAVAVQSAKAAPSANVLTPKANPCRWTPTCKPAANKHQAAQTPIARNNALIALHANVVNVVAVVDVAVANAMKQPVSAASNRVQKAVPMRQQKAMQMAIPATRANNKPAKAVVKVAMDVAVATDVAHARTAKAVTTLLAKIPSRPHSASQKLTTGPLLPVQTHSHPVMRMANHAMKTVKRVKNASVTVTAVNADPVVNAANVKSAQTCASRCKPLCRPTHRARHQPS